MKGILLALVIICCTACSNNVIHKINFSHACKPGTLNRVAILNFNIGNTHDITSDIIVDKFTAALVDSTLFKLVDRADIQKVMKEITFQGSSLIDEKTRQELRQLGADAVLTGTLISFSEQKRADGFILGSEVHLVAKLIKTETGEVLWVGEIMKREKAKSDSEVHLAKELLNDIVDEMSTSLAQRKGLLDKLKEKAS